MRFLTEDEFRLLAYLRGYADSCEQHLAPDYVQAQLEFSLDRMRRAARGLESLGLVELFEWEPSKEILLEHPELPEGPHMSDIKVTANGWHYFQNREVNPKGWDDVP